MENKFISKDEFIKGEIFRESIGKIQKIFLALFDMLDEQEVDYIVKVRKKVRKDQSIVIAVKGNENKNIVTITIYQEHLKLSIYKIGNVNIKEEMEVNEELKNNIMNKYYEINKEKKQISIYLDEALIGSITTKAVEGNQKLNEFVVDAINDKVNDKVNNVFLNDNHRKEFSILLKDAGLYSEDKYINRLPEDIRKRIALFYLVSPYEYHNDDNDNNAVKFTCNKETKEIQGPTEVIENWSENLYLSPMMAAFGIAEIFTSKENFHLLDSIFMEGYEEINTLFVNAINLLNGAYTIKNDDIVRVKLKEINMSGLLKY